MNPTVNAYCTLAADSARQAAREAEAAQMRGEERPLLGVPVSIKDLTDTAGIRTTSGSPVFANRVPAEDALVVSRLKSAGAIVLGKTNTPELGAGINTHNPLFGATRNPWDTSRGAGGSSGGAAAALAAGLCTLAEGSDHGGSLRIPASFCGIVALRTSPGRVPQYPGDWLYDPFSVTGPMARSVADAALMLSVMAGPDDRVPISLPEPGATFAQATEGDVRGLRVAWSRDLGVAAVDPEVAGVVEKAIDTWRSLGCVVEEACPDFHEVPDMIPPLRAVRTAATYQSLVERGSVDNPFFQDFLELSRALGALDVARAETQRSRLWENVERFFHQYDLLVTPATQTAAFPIEEDYPKTIDGRTMNGTVEAILLTYSISMTGLPAISIPCGFTAAGLPVGMQIVGRRHAEAAVLRAAAAFEAATPLALRPRLTVG